MDHSRYDLSFTVDVSGSPHARLNPVPLGDVRLSDEFWEPRREINRKVTLREQYEHLESSGTLDNFRRASGRIEAPFRGMYFADSDVYKWLEAASWTLAANPDPELGEMVERAIDEVEAAQEPDGYINTYFTFERKRERFTNLRDLHELYCGGHLIQAAIAHHRATGSERLLDVARRFADLVCGTFGPQSEGKLETADGHEEIEMALVELFRETGEHRYLEQARFFLDVRGRGRVSGSEYHQDHLPFREQQKITGHAVRATYLNAGAADVYAETGDEDILHALERLWHNMVTKRMYVSGGIGSRYEGEAFGKDYELPNERAYAESCAAIGSVMWSWRMLQITGEARYADLIEHTLYNAVLPGVSLDGRRYFYQNPLADDGTHRRQEWFGCACCPPNIARTLAALPGYFYSTSEGTVWVHLYAEGEANLQGPKVRLRQRTGYPWDGDVEVEVVSGEGEFSLMLRVPAWCEEARIEVNGAEADIPAKPGSYAGIQRRWRPGDTVRLHLPMPVRLLESHPYVLENTGRVAVMRGPILYCAEGADNPDAADLRDVVLTPDAGFSVGPHPELAGMPALHAPASIESLDPGWRGSLYRTRRLPTPNRRPYRLTLVPYLAWANRSPGPMQLWLRSG
ncbi:glycoside hydrolase family 127 protein [Rubrobacter calidifluminis]|uniref:glycoside hydrolase family 127 protein n=1 Tax=Rubrobacter calidifluminis TaxID=1392640 RepID=UPI0023609137|nr:beta-L-arabinofuranosidase domain-containing protein [Rubrobacter calidifluminis]